MTLYQVYRAAKLDATIKVYCFWHGATVSVTIRRAPER
jgi:hypothetical protein